VAAQIVAWIDELFAIDAEAHAAIRAKYLSVLNYDSPRSPKLSTTTRPELKIFNRS